MKPQQSLLDRVRMLEADNERYKASASRWRNEAYRLGGTPLPWSPDEALLRQALEAMEATLSGADYDNPYATLKAAADALRARLKD